MNRNHGNTYADLRSCTANEGGFVSLSSICQSSDTETDCVSMGIVFFLSFFQFGLLLLANLPVHFRMPRCVHMEIVGLPPVGCRSGPARQFYGRLPIRGNADGLLEALAIAGDNCQSLLPPGDRDVERIPRHTVAHHDGEIGFAALAAMRGHRSEEHTS